MAWKVFFFQLNILFIRKRNQNYWYIFSYSQLWGRRRMEKWPDRNWRSLSCTYLYLHLIWVSKVRMSIFHKEITNLNYIIYRTMLNINRTVYNIVIVRCNLYHQSKYRPRIENSYQGLDSIRIESSFAGTRYWILDKQCT